MNDCQEFLKKHGFDEYWSRFDSNGYDDLAQLKEMSTEELDEVLETDLNITKVGHRKRLRALLKIDTVVKQNMEKTGKIKVSAEKIEKCKH